MGNFRPEEVRRSIPFSRSRLRYAAAALLVIALGLATRPLKHIAESVGSALGDALYGMLIYLLLAVAFPRLRPAVLLAAATGICWLIESSQLLQVPWLIAFRQTTLGGLSVGGTFFAGDLGWYLLGTLALFLWERRRGEIKNAPAPKGEPGCRE